MISLTSSAVGLSIEGLDHEWQILEMLGKEALHAPYSFELRVRPVPFDLEKAPDLSDILGKRATLELRNRDGSSARTVPCVVFGASVRYDSFAMTLSHPLALAEQSVNHRVFVDRSAIDAAREILGAHGLRLTSRVVEPRSFPQRVQTFETDLSYLQRSLAEEGVTLLLPRDAADEVVATEPPFFDDLGIGTLCVRDSGMTTEDAVFAPMSSGASRVDRVSFRAYDFENPNVDLRCSSGSDGAHEIAEYSNDYRDPERGAARARIRLEELNARERELRAKTSSRALVPGYVVSIEGAGQEEKWLIVDVAHEMRDVGADSHYLASFIAIPAEVPFRPARPTAPRAQGVASVTVTGAKGSEIHTEEHGRVKAKLRWDRSTATDDSTSAWVRAVQPPLSGGVLLPRVGWEQLVSFEGASTDRPIALARLANGAAPPPRKLPGAEATSTYGTLTTPGGGSGNNLATVDDAGAEDFGLTASADYKEKTENDKVLGVQGSEAINIGGSRALIVGAVHQVSVGGAQSLSVGATRTVNVGANQFTQAASESVMVGALRIFDVGGDLATSSSTALRLVGAAKVEVAIEHQVRTVTGGSLLLVGGGWASETGTSWGVQIGGASTEVVGGVKSIKALSYGVSVKGVYSETFASRSTSAGGKREESYGASVRYSVGGSMTMKGSDLVVSAKSSITLRASGVTVKITPSSVTIDGEFDGGASVESGCAEFD